MGSKRLRDLLGFPEHASGADLVSYLDGELSRRKARRVERHLQACGRCRGELEKTERAIATFLECRYDMREAPPLHRWSRFPGMLRAASGERDEGRRSRPWWRHSLRWQIACGAAALAAVVLWFSLSPVRRVSANTLLDRAQAAEAQPGNAAAGGVVHRKIRIRRKGSTHRGEEGGVVESWTDAQLARNRQRSEGELMPELQRVLNANHMGGRPLLSASAFGEWRKSLPGRRDSVSTGKLSDGSAALTLTTIANDEPKPDAIVEASLVVKESDWRPVQENLRVAEAMGTREFELTEIALEVVPRDSLDASIFGPAPPAPAAAPAGGEARPVESRPDLEAESRAMETEIEAFYALHRAGACLGEGVTVKRSRSGRVQVEGMVETEERRTQLRRALAPVRGAEVNIALIGQPHAVPGPSRREAAPSEEPALQATGVAPIQEVLAARGATAPASGVSTRAVTRAEDWMAEAWALRRLAEAFPWGEGGDSRQPGRRLLAEMIHNHAAALQKQLSVCRLELQAYNTGEPPASPPQPKPAAWPEGAERAFTAASEAANLTRALCTGTPRTGQPALELFQQVLASLSAAESQARGLTDTSPGGNSSAPGKLPVQ